jgi:hypothetical protein
LLSVMVPISIYRQEDVAPTVHSVDSPTVS